MANPGRVCAECGTTVLADAPRGFCSVCLFQTGLASRDNEADEAFAPTIARMLKDFGDYELLEEIGRGGQGVVYRARQKSLNRVVALKVIGLAHWATEAHVKRFRLEAEAAARLNHPCIVPIYEVGERDGACYFSMGLVEGGPLDAVARSATADSSCGERDTLPIRHAAELIAKLARTVHYAHEHGILHRDIKPGNILLDPDGEPRLTDFGLARLVETENTVTRTLEVLGTPSYMAPEQAVGNNAAVTTATDIYGLGAVLYQLLTGHPPFAGGTTYETVRLALDTEPRQPRLWNRKIDRDLSTICLKCLDKDPQRRYSSALALAEDIERWLKHEPIRARRTGIFIRGRKWVQRNPTSALLAASLVALAAAIGGLTVALPFYWHRNLTTNLPADKSIAVLPFESLSKDEENKFFAAGVQDEILTNLAKVADLKVISRTSMMKYKSDSQRNLRDIAQTLGVSHVVEGSVQRAGGRVRVNVQLIDARNDAHLWAEHYDRDFADIFDIQSEIAQQIADQLRAKLSEAEKAAIAERPSSDLVAYAYYTRAKEINVYDNWEGAEKSATQKVELLEKAIQRDPNFALAYCALAKTQIDLSHVIGEATHREHLELAKKAAETALRVRPDLGETHLELARYYFEAGNATQDYDRARDELTIVRRKLPNNAEALFIEAMIGRHQNRWDASLANLQRASELDPRNTEIAFRLWLTCLEMRRYSQAEQLTTKDAASSKTEDPWIKRRFAEIKLAQGDPAAAQSLLQQIPLDFSPTVYIWSTRFKAVLYLRDYDAANRVIAAASAKLDFVFDESSDWAYAQVARARGDQRKTLAACAAARKKVDTTRGSEPENAPYLSHVAKIDAALGRKEEAIRQAQRAVELTPISKDSLNGPALVTNLALVYAWTGERDRALEQLEKVATIPGDAHLTPTYGDLRFNPCWDDLRGDVRFDKIVAAAKAASR
jgi:serine/threonine protein kinase/tetratricopeptide (TPR) repeat protein